MRGEALLRFRCPVCGGAFKLHDYRTVKDEIASGMLLCVSCPYRTVIKARIPILLPYGMEAVYRLPFERAAGRDWKKTAESMGWDSFFSTILKEKPDTPPRKTSVILSEKQFKRAIFRGSDYYFKNYIKPGEDDLPTPETEWQAIISEVIETAPRRLMEVGSGQGRFTRQLLKWRPGRGLYVALDMDFEALKILEGRYRRSGIRCLFDPTVADMRRIPLASEDFDMVVGHNGLTHVENFRHALSDIHRILAPGGLFCGVEPETGTDLHLDTTVDGLILHALKQKWGLHTGRNDFKAALRKTGFEGIQMRPLKTPRRISFFFKCRKSAS